MDVWMHEHIKVPHLPSTMFVYVHDTWEYSTVISLQLTTASTASSLDGLLDVFMPCVGLSIFLAHFSNVTLILD